MKITLASLFLVPALAFGGPVTKEEIRHRINTAASLSCQSTNQILNLLEARDAQAEFKAHKSNMNMPMSVTPASMCFAVGGVVALSQDIGRYIAYPSLGKDIGQLTDSEISIMTIYLEAIGALSIECGVEQGTFLQVYGDNDINKLDFVKIKAAVYAIKAQGKCSPSTSSGLVAE